jgi:hypothetical protein
MNCDSMMRYGLIRDSADQFRMTGFGHQWKLVWAGAAQGGSQVGWMHREL